MEKIGLINICINENELKEIITLIEDDYDDYVDILKTDDCDKTIQAIEMSEQDAKDTIKKEDI